ncbi:MAG: hypothetical protein ACFB03_19435 [Paracoccaceae bacterium]
MKLVITIARILPILLASSAIAEQDRLDRLTNSYLISNLERDEGWFVSRMASSLNYECLKCSGEVNVQLEVVAPYSPKKFGSFQKRYLTERKAFCANMAVQSSGRCIGTEAIGMRGGALSGFLSTHELENRHVTEIVFFYNNAHFGPLRGPELIRTKLTSESTAHVPNGIVETLMWHMARLTVFW